MRPTAIVIGAGFAGLSAAASLGRRGYAVTVMEKNATAGGRARVLESQGYLFDMGPSWYWMPDIFEAWFAEFGHSVADFYDLRRLDPSYQVIFGPEERWEIPASKAELIALFERIEPGSGPKLQAFLADARVKYDLGMRDLVRSPSLRWSEFAKARVLRGLFTTAVFSSMRQHVRRSFTDPRLRMLLEFPVLFLGATPERTPALYSLMNHADMELGTWYPMGGMGKVVDAMVAVAREQGVDFRFGTAVDRLLVDNGHATGVRTNTGSMRADVVVAAADYHHVDQQLVPEGSRSYTPEYWKGRVMAPSAILFYLGFARRLPKLHHHNLFFDRSLDRHASEIYDAPTWPSDPLLYVCAPTRTDPHVAPAGHENVFGLIPIAPDLEDTPAIRTRYREMFLDRLSAHTGVDLRAHLDHERIYSINDLKHDHNAFRGNAYGLANTLRQSAVWKPSMKSRKVKGLYFAGQLTTPGPGVPPSIISGQVVAELIDNERQPSTRPA